MGMSIYTYMYVKNLDNYIAKKTKKAEEKANATTEVPVETAKEKIDNKINLINPGTEFVIKNDSIEITDKRMIRVNVPAKVSHRRRG